MHKPLHLIGINDPMMVNLAIALQKQGHPISVSDQALAEPLQQQLKQAGLLPQKLGFFPAQITQALDQVIISRELPLDNQELQTALQAGMAVHAYPEYIYGYAQDKQRIVLTGGPEVIDICAVAMHVLHYWHRAFDYVINQPISGWENLVQLTDAPVILLQADALPTSTWDQTPQMLTYQHHIALISGINEEQVSGYVTLDGYLKTLETLGDATPKGGILIYNQSIPLLDQLSSQTRPDVKTLTYQPLAYRPTGNIPYLSTSSRGRPMAYIEDMSLPAIAAAQLLVQNLGIDQVQFEQALPSFNLVEP